MKILLVIFVLLLNSLNAQSNEILVYSDKLEMSENIIKPKVRSWSELKDLYLDSNYSLSKTRLNSCHDTDKEELTLIGSYYQNIIYNDYRWKLLYSKKTGLYCVEMIQPEAVFLTSDEAEILLLASRGEGFNEMGLWDESRKYLSQLNQFSKNCEKNYFNEDTSKHFNLNPYVSNSIVVEDNTEGIDAITLKVPVKELNVIESDLGNSQNKNTGYKSDEVTSPINRYHL